MLRHILRTGGTETRRPNIWFSLCLGVSCLSTLSALGFVLAACGGSGPEQQILTTFFRASRVRDSVTLANMSAVTLDPREDGTVQDFTITNVAPDARRQLQIKQLMQDEEAAKKEDADFTARKRQYQDANIKAIERVIKAEGAKQPVKGPDAVVQAAWAKWREEQSVSQKKLSAAKEKVARERAVAVDSLTAPGRPDVDPTGLEVELITRQVTVDAQVKSPDGQTAPKTLVFTLQRAVGTPAGGGETMEGRWLIIGLK